MLSKTIRQLHTFHSKSKILKEGWVDIAHNKPTQPRKSAGDLARDSSVWSRKYVKIMEADNSINVYDNIDDALSTDSKYIRAAFNINQYFAPGNLHDGIDRLIRLGDLYIRCNDSDQRHEWNNSMMENFVKFNPNIHYPFSMECKHLQSEGKCNIYEAITEHNQLTENNLNHMRQYNHFDKKFNIKPECAAGINCKHYQNTLIRVYGDIEADCHMQCYSHPARIDRMEQMQSDNIFHDFQYDEGVDYENTVWRPSREWLEKWKKEYVEGVGLYHHLIEEVIENGFERDLLLKNDVTIDNKVNDIYNHPRHTQYGKPLDKGQILALILYTEGECNYDLCAAHREGDFLKWKMMHHALMQAIYWLSLNERGSKYELYTGLNGVKLKTANSGHFKQYTSTTYDWDVALQFKNGGVCEDPYLNHGMIIKLNAESRFYANCCDVSWISAFPDEKEVLFNRGTAFERLETVGYIKQTQVCEMSGFKRFS